MAHGITKQDSMFSVNQVPWHGLGVILPRRPKTVKEALTKAGLAWKVNQDVTYRKVGGKYIAIPQHQFNVRADVRDPVEAVLGVVSDEYKPVQNLQAFEFLASLIGTELNFETAGSLWAGRWVWALAGIPDWLEVGGDQLARFILVSLRHDGTGGVKSLPTTVRVVCNNTITAAERRGEQYTYTVRHIGDVNNQLAEARKVMNVSINYYKQFKKFGDKLASQKMAERQLRKVLDDLYPNGADLGLGNRAVQGRQRTKDQITQLFKSGKTVGNAPGSKWCGYNAIIEHYAHVRPQRSAQGTFLRHFADQDGFKSRALELVVNS